MIALDGHSSPVLTVDFYRNNLSNPLYTGTLAAPHKNIIARYLIISILFSFLFLVAHPFHLLPHKEHKGVGK
jgi:hypothetical protein